MTIISFSQNFIFVKTRKTASSSMEVHLARVCGADDIVTPIEPPNPTHQPRNYGDAYYNHMPAALIESLQPETFAHCFKFCFERHPVNKCISSYAMRKHPLAKFHSSHSWEAYLERGQFPIDHARYCSADGRVLVDKIYRYENFEESVRDIERQLNVSFGPVTTQEKSGRRDGTPGVPTFDEVMSNAEQKGRIMSAFAESLRITPYE